MALINGEIANADEVLNAMGSIFNDTAQNLFNAAYIGFDSDLNYLGEPKLKNVLYNTMSTGEIKISGLQLYDFSGSTVDTTYWTTSFSDPTYGSYITQGSDSITVATVQYDTGTSGYSTFAELKSNGSTGIKLLDGSYFFNFSWYLQNQSSVTSGTPIIYVTDGTTSVVIFSQSAPSGSTDSGHEFKRLNINKTNETCLFTDDLSSLVETGVDLSSLNNTVDWYIRFRAQGAAYDNPGDGAWSNFVIYDFRDLQDTTEAEYIVDLGTADETITNLIPIANTTLYGSSTATYELTVDDSNYETFVNTEILRPTNTGTPVKMKITLASDSSGNISTFGESAIKYNLY